MASEADHRSGPSPSRVKRYAHHYVHRQVCTHIEYPYFDAESLVMQLDEIC